MKNKKLILSIVFLSIVVILTGLLIYGYVVKTTYKLKRPIATMEIEGYGTVKMELYPDIAPNTVENFIKLANEGYYNGLTFTRVEENLIQSASKELVENETAYSIKGEFSDNEFKNNLKFERGTIGLGRADYSNYYYTYYYYAGDIQGLIEEEYNSGFGSFFIMTDTEEEFDGRYAAFGKVIEGMDIIDQITQLETEITTDEESGETTETTTPVNPPVITNITIDTQGVKYGEPERQEAFDINQWFANILTTY